LNRKANLLSLSLCHAAKTAAVHILTLCTHNTSASGKRDLWKLRTSRRLINHSTKGQSKQKKLGAHSSSQHWRSSYSRSSVEFWSIVDTWVRATTMIHPDPYS
jgi:hypothetical protein